jgi:hypothetical protein
MKNQLRPNIALRAIGGSLLRKQQISRNCSSMSVSQRHRGIYFSKKTEKIDRP